MSWKTQQYTKRERRVRHARISLRVNRCEECGCELHATHQVMLFGGRCRVCFDVYTSGGVVVVLGRAS